MAGPFYLDAGGDDSDGLTLAKAKQTMADADTLMAAGETLYVEDDHSEAPTSTITYDFTAGTPANPVRIICGDVDAAEPPTALSTYGVIALSGSYIHITIKGAIYMYGMDLAVEQYLYLGNTDDDVQTYEKCIFRVAVNLSGAGVSVGANLASSRITWIDCDLDFDNAGQGVLLSSTKFIWNGGGLLGASSAITRLFTVKSDGAGSAELNGVDLTNAASSLDILDGSTNQAGSPLIVLRNCQLPASWTGSAYDATPTDTYRPGAGDTCPCSVCGSQIRLPSSPTSPSESAHHPRQHPTPPSPPRV